jgi:hypothetical protein
VLPEASCSVNRRSRHLYGVFTGILRVLSHYCAVNFLLGLLSRGSICARNTASDSCHKLVVSTFYTPRSREYPSGILKATRVVAIEFTRSALTKRSTQTLLKEVKVCSI